MVMTPYTDKGRKSTRIADGKQRHRRRGRQFQKSQALEDNRRKRKPVRKQVSHRF